MNLDFGNFVQLGLKTTSNVKILVHDIYDDANWLKFAEPPLQFLATKIETNNEDNLKVLNIKLIVN